MSFASEPDATPSSSTSTAATTSATSRRVLRCPHCPQRKYRTSRDLALHILSNHRTLQYEVNPVRAQVGKTADMDDDAESITSSSPPLNGLPEESSLRKLQNSRAPQENLPVAPFQSLQAPPSPCSSFTSEDGVSTEFAQEGLTRCDNTNGLVQDYHTASSRPLARSQPMRIPVVADSRSREPLRSSPRDAYRAPGFRSTTESFKFRKQPSTRLHPKLKREGGVTPPLRPVDEPISLDFFNPLG